MTTEQAIGVMQKERAYLNNILKDFTPDHGDFAPVEGMMTTAQQIRHIARTIIWFREGAFGDGFDMDFETYEAENRRAVSFNNAMSELHRTYDDYCAFLEGYSDEDLCAPMLPNEIMGPLPRFTAISAQADHTAHHRGVLSVYLRMLGITPTMVYAE
jgi:uncharacterized damage-inducible protein DinB